MKNIKLNFFSLICVAALFTLSFNVSSQEIELPGLEDGKCTVRVSCGALPNNFVECSSDNGDCDRDGQNQEVTCDGETTSC